MYICGFATFGIPTAMRALRAEITYHYSTFYLYLLCFPVVTANTFCQSLGLSVDVMTDRNAGLFDGGR